MLRCSTHSFAFLRLALLGEGAYSAVYKVRLCALSLCLAKFGSLPFAMFGVLQVLRLADNEIYALKKVPLLRVLKTRPFLPRHPGEAAISV